MVLWSASRALFVPGVGSVDNSVTFERCSRFSRTASISRSALRLASFGCVPVSGSPCARPESRINICRLIEMQTLLESWDPRLENWASAMASYNGSRSAFTRILMPWVPFELLNCTVLPISQLMPCDRQHDLSLRLPGR